MGTIGEQLMRFLVPRNDKTRALFLSLMNHSLAATQNDANVATNEVNSTKSIISFGCLFT